MLEEGSVLALCYDALIKITKIDKVCLASIVKSQKYFAVCI